MTTDRSVANRMRAERSVICSKPLDASQADDGVFLCDSRHRSDLIGGEGATVERLIGFLKLTLRSRSRIRRKLTSRRRNGTRRVDRRGGRGLRELL